MAWIGLIFPYSPRFMDINEFGITACRKDQERIYVKQILLNVYLFRKDTACFLDIVHVLGCHLL